ncbi:MAG TPA: DUF6531 domain-containing protein [Phycisphaerae bacterium]|nr:DUF6531 domain-containing protein [Phycisphaerae bacterium]
MRSLRPPSVIALSLASFTLLSVQPSARSQCPCPCPADTTGNILRDGIDVDDFVRCLLSGPTIGPGCSCADMDLNSLVDLADTPLFANTLLAPGPCSVAQGSYEPGPLDMPPASPCSEGESCSGMPDTRVAAQAYFFSGEVYQSATDLRIRGRGLDFIWARKYRSRNGPVSAMGHGWDYSYNSYLEAAGADRILHDGNTRADLYLLQPNGKWGRDEFFRELQLNGDTTYTLIFADTGKWNFRSLANPIAPGRISTIVDRNNNTMAFIYDGLGRLISIADTLGRVVTVAYDANSRISTVTDFTGRQVIYTYDANGDLRTVRSPVVTGTPHGNDYPAGKSTSYTYSSGFADSRLNHNLLTITDPKGQTYLQNVYASTLDPADLNFDRLVRQTWGQPGDVIDMTYVAQSACGGNNFAALKTVVNDRVGNVREYSYDALNRLVMAREYTGRADPDQPTTESTNRPTSKLRPTDPDYFETRWTYNADSQTTLIAYPNLNTTAKTYELDLNPLAARRERGNLRSVTRNPGPLGGDQASITESYTYETGFGGCGCGTNFVKTHTDGRGNVTMHTYDAAGNRLHTDHRPGGGVEDWTYNVPFGQVISHTLPANGSAHRRVDTYSYYAAGPQMGYLQTEVIDSGGFNLTNQYEYDAVGNVIRIVHPNSADSLYTYNALDQVVRTLSREVLPVIRYETLTWYNANDNVVRTDVENRDENGVLQPNTHFSTITEYEILNHIVRTCQERGTAALSNFDLSCPSFPPGEAVTTEYEYDANRNQIRERRPMSFSGLQPTNTVDTEYDERDLHFKVIRSNTDPAQSTDQTDYDGNGNVAARRRGLEDIGNERVTMYAYDGYNRGVSSTDPMGNVTTYHYDANDNMTSQRTDGELLDVPGNSGSVRLSETSYQYDAMDRRTRQDIAHFDTLPPQPAIGDGLSTTLSSYANNSQTTSVTTDLPGHVTNYTYDTANRLLTTTDAKLNTSTHSYDADSNVISMVETDKSDLGNPNETFTTTYAYDLLDRLTSTTDNVGNTHQYVYNSRNNRVRTIDARGNHTRYEYDGLNRPGQTARDMNGNLLFTDPVDIVSTQTWDDSSRLTGQTDDNGNPTMYIYDALNRRTGADHADCTSDFTYFDVHDNAVSTTDANGSVVSNNYDLNNRLTTRSISPGTGVSGQTTLEIYAYDGLGRMSRAEDDDSLVIRAYDSLGNILSETQQRLNPDGPALTLAGVYDGEGNLTRQTYPGGRVIVRTYDLLDRPLLIRNDPLGPGAIIATYAYIGPYRVERRDYPNGSPAERVRATYAYDGDRRILSTTHTRNPTGSPVVIDQRTYTWDPNDNKLSMEVNSAPIPTDIHNYAYDASNRLIQWDHVTPTPPGPVDYVLDGVGNRVSVSGGPNPGPYTMDPTLCEAGDFEMNQYTTTPFNASRLYDQNGSLSNINSGAETFAYDYRNQLVNFLAASVSAEYRYDCLGRRIEKAVAFDAPPLRGPGGPPVIDGTLDSAYGNPVAIQNTQTQFGDSNTGQVDFANGSELDGVSAVVQGGVLYLMLSCNLESNFNKLEVFIDSGSGGQNRLRGDNSGVDFGGLNRMGDDGGGNGLTFDAGFAADFWLGMTGGDGGGGIYALFANYAELLTAGGGPGYYLGAGTAVSDGTLDASGSNPFGIRVTIHNGNTSGVTGGTGADSGAGVSTGVEWAIPLAAIGAPTGEIKLCVFVNAVGHDFVSNQMLGGIGGGDNLGEPRSVNFNSISGNQCFSVIVPPSAAAAVTSYAYSARRLIEARDATRVAVTTVVSSNDGNSQPADPYADLPDLLALFSTLPLAEVIDTPAQIGTTDTNGLWWRGFLEEELQMEQGGQKSFFHADNQNSVAKLTDQTGNVLSGWEYEDYGKPIAQLSTANTQPPDQQQAYRSDLSNQEPGPQAIADDFTLAQPETITGLRWWGAYDPGIQAHTNDFHITIFDDNSGAPGNPIFQETAGNNVAAAGTGQVVGGEDERIYEYALSQPFPAQAGVTYWLSIENTLAQPGITPWKWESGGNGNNQSFWSSDQFGPWNQQPADLAFALLVPQPDIDNPFLFHGHFFDRETGLYWCGGRYLATGSGRYIQRAQAGTWVNGSSLGNPYSFDGNNPSSPPSAGLSVRWLPGEFDSSVGPVTARASVATMPRRDRWECEGECSANGYSTTRLEGRCWHANWAGKGMDTTCANARANAIKRADEKCAPGCVCFTLRDNDRVKRGSCVEREIGGLLFCECTCRVRVYGECM